MTTTDLPSGLIYLASPYSHPDPEVRLYRARMAAQATTALIRQGLVVHSPIAHSVGLLQLTNVDLGHEFAAWERQDLGVIAAATSIVVLMLPGWERSVGIRRELDFARRRGLMPFYLDPKTMDVSTELEVAA